MASYSDLEKGITIPSEPKAEEPKDEEPKNERWEKCKDALFAWINLTGRRETDVYFIFTYFFLTATLIAVGSWMIYEKFTDLVLIAGILLVVLSWWIAKYLNKGLFVFLFFSCCCFHQWQICPWFTECLYRGP